MEVKDYTLTLTTEQAQKNIDELNESFELQEELVDGLEKELRKYEKELNATSKNELAKRESIISKMTKTKEKLKDEKIALKDVNKERKKANDTLKETNENAKDYSGVLGMIDSKTGGLISGLTGMTKSVGGATKGFNLMKIAIIGTGIGALLIGIVALKAAFSGSEEGQNKFAKIMAVIGALTGNLVDLLADLGDAIIAAFEDPKKAWEEFTGALKSGYEFIKAQVVDRLTGSFNIMTGKIQKNILKMRIAWNEWTGDSDEAKLLTKALDDVNDKIKEGEELIKGANKEIEKSYNSAKNSVKGFIEEQVKEGNAAAGVADMRAKADKIERELIVSRSKLESEIALLRLKSRQEDQFSATERRQALLDAQVLEESLLDKETQFLELRRDAQIQENTFSRSNKENLTKEAEAIAAVNRQQASRANTARQVQREVNTISKQIEGEEKVANNKVIAEQKALAAFKKGLRVVDANDKLAALETERENNLLALEELKVNEIAKGQLKLDIEKSFTDKKKAIEDAAKVVEDEAKATFLEAQLGKQELDLEEQRALALSDLEKLKGTEEEKNAIIAHYDKLELDDEKVKRDAEIDMAKNTFAGIANLLGENSKAGKAAAVAAALINTYQGITAELATKTATPFGFAMKLVNIASTAAIGFKSVKSIMATKESGGANVSNPAAGVSAASAEPMPPEFSTVGASGTNQLADAIGGQTQQPVQAFVVSQDVTTAQSLERNIISSATIG
tara:strand:+ start:234 stop:2444 length:2211 start_codon:yes stop_codon:yes gene_type:complete